MLLAEDNIVNQRVAVGLLTKRGHEVAVAVNGIDALGALERDAFDVVLMDIQMPEMGGLEATAEFAGQSQRLLWIARLNDAIAGALKADAGQQPYGGVVFDEQDRFGSLQRRGRRGRPLTP